MPRNLVEERSKAYTDINDHLITIYDTVVNYKHPIILECGIRGGESSFAFKQAITDAGGVLYGIDIVNCADAYAGSTGVFKIGQAKNAKTIFPNNIAYDIIFLDTSHKYAETVDELNNLWPLLKLGGKFIFHDTNLTATYKHLDGAIGATNAPDDGVTRAVQEFFKISLQQDTISEYKTDQIRATHYPYCCGLLIVERLL